MKVLDVLFLLIIVGVGIIGIILVLKNKKNEANVCSNMATSLGVLGTFVGISMGLAKFDTAPGEIAQSVPNLLNGMKFAFITSIAGMITSIVIKAVISIVDNLKNKDNNEEIDNIEDLFISMSNEIKNLNATLTNNQTRSDRTIAKLGEMFKENQNDLKVVLESLNNSLNRKQDILIDEFRKFGNQMAQNNTDALIDALNGVIRDFNNKISEQFGENFKELNIAVTKLLEWQENYKETLEYTTNQLRVTVESMKSVDNSLNNINKNSIKLIEASESMDNALKAVSVSQEEVKHGLSSMIEIADMAKESIPNLDSYFERTNKNILEISKQSMEGLKEQSITYIRELADLTNELNTTIPGISKQINENYEVFTKTLDYLSTNTSNTIKFATEEIEGQCETLRKTNADLGNKLQVQLDQIHEDTSKQIVKIVEEMEKIFADRADKVNDMLEHELKESLNSLGTQLATLSGRFVEDYMPLTEKLREVVQIAQGV